MRLSLLSLPIRTLPLLLAVQRTKGTEDLFWDRVITKGERTPEDFTRARIPETFDLALGNLWIGME